MLFYSLFLFSWMVVFGYHLSWGQELCDTNSQICGNTIISTGFLAIAWFNGKNCTGPASITTVALGVCMATGNTAIPYKKFVHTGVVNNYTSGSISFYNDSECTALARNDRVYFPPSPCADVTDAGSHSYTYLSNYTTLWTYIKAVIPSGFLSGFYNTTDECRANNGTGFLTSTIRPVGECIKGHIISECGLNSTELTLFNTTNSTRVTKFTNPRLVQSFESPSISSTRATHSKLLSFDINETTILTSENLNNTLGELPNMGTMNNATGTFTPFSNDSYNYTFGPPVMGSTGNEFQYSWISFSTSTCENNTETSNNTVVYSDCDNLDATTQYANADYCYF